MKTFAHLALACTLLIATPAFAGMHACEASSDYSLSFNDGSLAFRSDSAKPARVELRQGHLFIDGQEQPLTAADSKRIADFESGVRRLLPQVKEIALDAVDIAFDAVEAVAVGFSAVDNAQMGKLHERLGHAREQLRRGIESRIVGSGWTDADIEELVKSSVQALVPALVQQLAAGAVLAALSGDESVAHELEKRAERMAADVESRVKARARQLERRADALCPQVSDLVALVANLDLRLDGNRAIQLFRR
jgi:Protein of unknown function (DUF2884)